MTTNYHSDYYGTTTSYGKAYKKTYTNAALKKEIKAGFTEELRIGQKWHVIPMDWFDKWKFYINYDNDSNETHDDLIPGAIDTSNLLIGETGQLKKTNVPNKDYVLLPNDCAEELYIKFQCNNKIVRETINNGTTYQLLISVEMFPIRVGFHICTKERPEPGDHEEIEKFILCSSKMTYNQLTYKIKQECHYGYNSDMRLWLRDNSKVETKTFGKRKLTTDVTDVHNGWRFLRNTSYSVTLNDLADGKDYIEVLAEVVQSNYAKEEEWPRFKYLTKWLQNLQVGDHVDIYCLKAVTSKFLEAEIIEVNQADSVKVHFRALDDSHNQLVSINNTLIKPLFSETTNWRDEIEEDQEIELKEDNKWIKATIVDLNLKEMKIKVSYTPSTPSIYSGAYTSSVEDCDDLVKKATSTSTDVVIYQAPQSEKKSKWIDIESDDICELYTHLSKPVVKHDAYSYGGDYYNKKYKNDWGEKSTKGKPIEIGAVGLKNLGNTCFMNSILQCLSNTPVITEFFSGNKYKEEINTDNPLGHNGKVAQSYGKFIKELWGDAYSTVVPRDLKDTIGEFQPQFAGYQQQDSQELLQFLLDGLHEDLNRVKKKPFTSTIESKGRADDLISRESWRRYLLRNDSKIVDHCFGQYKSHVTCTNCHADSVTFEAFNILNLPIPVKQTKEHEVSVRLLPYGSPAYKVKVEVGMYDSVHQFKQKVLQKLISCQILAASDVDLESKSEVPTTSQTKQIQDNDIDDDWISITSTETKSGVETSNSSSITTLHTKEAYSQHVRTRASSSTRTLNCFHVASMHNSYYQQCSISKNHAPNDGIYNANSVFVLFEVESPCPENKPVNAYDKGFVDSNAYTLGYDVVIGKIVDSNLGYGHASTAYNKKFESSCLINRIVCTRDSTWKDVDEKIWQMVQPYIKDSTQTSGSRLYTIHVGGSFAHYSCQFKQISDMNNDLVMNTISIADVIYVAFEKHALELLNLDAMKFVTPVSEKSVDVTANREEGTLNIYKCLDKFCEREQLEATETVYCSNCKLHNAPIKKFDLWATPDILMVQLKRFLYVPGQYFVHREKISDLVDFPIEGLDLSSYLKGPISPDNPPLYDLYAVSLHSGGLGGGHYTAICKNSASNKWFNFNDSFVSSANATDAVTTSAYVLFYKRRNATVKWAGIRPLETPLSDE